MGRVPALGRNYAMKKIVVVACSNFQQEMLKISTHNEFQGMSFCFYPALCEVSPVRYARNSPRCFELFGREVSLPFRSQVLSGFKIHA